MPGPVEYDPSTTKADAANTAAIAGNGDHEAHTPAEVLAAGFFGVSPQFERTDEADKGLSQANWWVMGADEPEEE